MPAYLAKDTAKGQMTLPAGVRNALGVERGGYVRLEAFSSPTEVLYRAPQSTSLALEMADVRNGQLAASPEWWKHLRWAKRSFWKRERQAGRGVAREEIAQIRGVDCPSCRKGAAHATSDHST
jgi:hypothetical protein